MQTMNDNLREWREFAIEYTDEYGLNRSMSSVRIIEEPEEGEIEDLCSFIADFIVSIGYSPTTKSKIQFIDWKLLDYDKPQEYFKDDRFIVTLDDKTVDFDIWNGKNFEKYGDRVIAWADEITPFGGDPYSF